MEALLQYTASGGHSLRVFNLCKQLTECPRNPQCSVNPFSTSWHTHTHTICWDLLRHETAFKSTGIEMIEKSQSLHVEDGRPYTYTLLRRRSSIQSFNDNEIPRKVSPSWPKMLLLVAKVRTCTTNFGTENETPSIRQIPPVMLRRNQTSVRQVSHPSARVQSHRYTPPTNTQPTESSSHMTCIRTSIPRVSGSQKTKL